tara:strand:+ start:434 stop:3151 length:2718 start_codon:yes stop_codon:yes gene_type:complete
MNRKKILLSKPIRLKTNNQSSFIPYETYYQTQEIKFKKDKTLECESIVESSGKKCTSHPSIEGMCIIHFKTHSKKVWRQQMTDLGYRLCQEKTNKIFICQELLDEMDHKHIRCKKHRDKDKVKNDKRAKDNKKNKEENPNFIDEKGIEQEYCPKCKKYCNESGFRGVKGDKTKVCKNCLEYDRQIHSNNSNRSCVLAGKTCDYLKNSNKKGKKWGLEDSEGGTVLERNPKANYLFHQNCFYCEEPPHTNKYTGIDRLNVEKQGYDVEKIVPACTPCNMMIGKKTLSDYRNICEHIATYNNLYEGKMYPEYFIFNNPNYTYEFGKNQAYERGFEWTLTIDEFKEIIKNPCHYCGTKPFGREGGIDRYENNLHYTKENSVSACTTCNDMKKDLSSDVFLDKCKKASLSSYKKTTTCWDNYNTIEKLKDIIKLNVIKPQFGRNNNELTFYQQIYLSQNQSSISVSIEIDNELDILYRFMSFKYLGLYPDQIEFSKHSLKIFLKDNITNRYIGYIFANNEDGNIIIKRILPFGIFFSRKGYKFLYDLTLSIEIIEKIKKYFQLKELNEIYIRKETYHNFTLNNVVLWESVRYTQSDNDEVVMLMKLLTPKTNDAQFIKFNAYRKIGYNTNQINIDYDDFQIDIKKLDKIFTIVEKNNLINITDNIAKIDNLVIKDKYKQGRGMASENKNTAKRTGTQNTFKKDVVPQIKKDVFRDQEITRLSEYYKSVNTFSKCQGNLFTQKPCKLGKRAVIGNKFCGDHKKSILKEYADSNEKVLCRKLKYTECTVYIDSEDILRGIVNCKGCRGVIAKDQEKYRKDNQEYLKKERERAKENRQNKKEQQQTHSKKKSFHEKYNIDKLDQITEKKLIKYTKLIKNSVQENIYITNKDLIDNNNIPRRSFDEIKRFIEK